MRKKIFVLLLVVSSIIPNLPVSPLTKGGIKEWLKVERGGIIGIALAQQAGEKKESVCVKCHSQLGGKFAEPVKLWNESIHKEMGNNCDGCHGGDPTDPARAMIKESGFLGKPKITEIPNFCGKCHVGVKENYLKSAHGMIAAKTGAPNCTTCHNSHDVKKASLDLINEKSCTRCHTYEKPQKIKQALAGSEAEIARLAAQIKDAKGSSIDTRRLEEKLFAARNAIHQTTHVLSVEKINAMKAATDKELKEVDASLKIIEKEIAKRKRIAIGVMIFCFAAAGVILLYRKTFLKPESWFKV
ncbi:MAG: cytochrome c3 family protein [Nitrospirae bacterium]|nr:cytochrome c3 family protein [Nitrospirota bacterium]